MTLSAPTLSAAPTAPDGTRSRTRRPDRRLSDYTELSQRIKAAGLLQRSFGFYAGLATV